MPDKKQPYGIATENNPALEAAFAHYGRHLVSLIFRAEHKPRQNTLLEILNSSLFKIAALALISVGTLFEGGAQPKPQQPPANKKKAEKLVDKKEKAEEKKDLLLSRPEIKNIILVAGPGNEAFSKKDVDKAVEGFKQIGANVTVIGDGKKSITLEEINKAVAAQKGNVTVVVHAHGEVKDEKHCIDLGGKCDVPSEKLFEGIKIAAGGKIVDCFMTSCHGSAAEEAAMKILPKGSVFVALAPGSETVAGGDVKRFFETLPESPVIKRNVSAEKMLDDYLVTDLKTRIPPRITVVGQASYDLEGMFRSRLGKAFTKEEKGRITDRLSQYFDKEKIEAVITKIETAKDEYDIGAKDFGTALAVTFAATDRTKEIEVAPPKKGFDGDEIP